MFLVLLHVKGLKGHNTLAQVEGLRKNGGKNSKSDSLLLKTCNYKISCGTVIAT